VMRFVQKCMRFLRRFMEKATLLFVNHDTGSVINLCRHAYGCRAVRAVGSPKDMAEYLADLLENIAGAKRSTRRRSKVAIRGQHKSAARSAAGLFELLEIPKRY